jgi:hypothetical protein
MNSIRYRRTGARHRVLHDAFMGAVAAHVPHLEAEAAEEAQTLWGPRPAAVSYPAVGEIAGLIARLERRAEHLKRAAKRGPITAEMAVKVDGEVSAQFAKVWTAYRNIPGVPVNTNRVTVGETHVTLSWQTGAYRIFREAVVGAAPDLAGYTGAVEFDEVLLRRGGPFQLDITPGGPRATDLSGKVCRWRICLAMMRETGARRGSVYHADLLHRFRSGNAVTFRTVTKYGRASTQVTIAPGKADPAWVRRVNAGAQIATARVERLRTFVAALEGAAEAAAHEFCGEPTHIAENGRREYRAAAEEFNSASGALYRTMQAAVYKRDLPPAPYTSRPENFPPVKAVGHGVRHEYDRAQGWLTSAWERLVAARQANPDPVEAAPAAAPAPAPVAGNGQVLLVLG